MSKLVTALASSLPVDGVPEEIVYIPEGDNHIYPQSHPEGILVKMPASRGEAVAASFQQSLERLSKSNVRPRLDFKHDASGPTSGFPKSFRYQQGRGLMCSVDWSGAGRSAIEGRDFAYFSPRFDLGDDGIPAGLPQRGPLGALVNEPAFREIERIAASAAEAKDQSTITMSALILATCGLLTEAEAARENAAELARIRVTAMKGDETKLSTVEAELVTLKKERDDLKTKVEASEKAAKEAAGKRADTLVAAAVTDGRIGAKDEESLKDFRERITAGDAFAEKMLAALPKLNGDMGKPVIEAGGAERSGAQDDKFKDLKGGDLLEAALAADAK